MINIELARTRGLGDETVVAIEKCQWYLDEVLMSPSVFLESPSDVLQHIHDLEYKLQGMWGFPQDKKFHRYDYHVKWCTCPKMDNDDMAGHTDKRYINVGCPYHGQEPATSWDDKRFNGGIMK